MAMKLLEKDIHEKQDTIVSLRRQLEDIKQINLEMYNKLQVGISHTNRATSAQFSRQFAFVFFINFSNDFASLSSASLFGALETIVSLCFLLILFDLISCFFWILILVRSMIFVAALVDYYWFVDIRTKRTIYTLCHFPSMNLKPKTKSPFL